MAGHDALHFLGMLLPQRRASLNIGKEIGNQARRQVRAVFRKVEAGGWRYGSCIRGGSFADGCFGRAQSPFGGSQIGLAIPIFRVYSEHRFSSAAYRSPIIVGDRLLCFIQETVQLSLNSVTGRNEGILAFL